MQLTKCPNGHFYDASLNPTCPHCTGASANANRTVPLVGVNEPATPPMGSGSDGKTEGAGYAYNFGSTVPVGGGAPARDNNASDEDEKTVAVIMGKTGIDPVIAWLVCIEGAERGRDFRLHDGNNYIGRDAKMDVCIHGDDQISRENHAWLAYDSLNKRYIFGSGMGRNIVYHNGAPIIGTQTDLEPYDKITLGNTTLMFVPFCGNNFNWA